MSGCAVDAAVAEPAPGAGGWRATLSLRFERGGGKTVLRRSHHGPLMIQRPFYPEGGDVCHAYVLHPPGGIVGGDQLLLDARCSDGAAALVTTPGATKYYGSDGRVAAQLQRLSVGAGALEWMPQETIYFDGCRAMQTLQIELVARSRLIGWDISCFGRPAGNHVFRRGDVCSKLSLYRDGKPLLLERLHLRSADELNRLSGLRGALVNGTFFSTLCNGGGDDILPALRARLPGGGFSATCVDDLIVVRYLGDSAEAARLGFVEAWRLLRPIAIGRDVVVPRIWAT